MVNMRICPRCGTDIAPEKHRGILICDCGWYDAGSEAKVTKELETKTIYVLIASTIALFLAYVHVANWGSHALSIPVLRLEQMTGLMGPKGYEELANACLSVGKYSCAENAYLQVFNTGRNPESLSRLAHFQIRLGKVNDASATYAQYFKVGGKNGDAMLAYAKVLEVTKQNAQAIKMYEASIEAHSETLPVQAVGGIIRILMKEGRYKDAYRRLQAFHDSAGNAKGYLNTELAQLTKIVGSKADRGIASRKQGV